MRRHNPYGTKNTTWSSSASGQRCDFCFRNFEFDHAVHIYECCLLLGAKLFQSPIFEKDNSTQLESIVSTLRPDDSGLNINTSEVTRVASEFAEVHKVLTDKEHSLIKGLKEEEVKFVSIMERHLKYIQDKLISIQGKLANVGKQMKQKDGAIFLKEETSRKSSLNETGQKVSVTGGSLSMGHFNCTLPFAVWREYIDTVKSDSVTLDEGSAHPELEVSGNLMNVRLTGVRRSLRNNRKRFMECFYALRSEGFTSRRHYWEVEVAGSRRWSLGVAAESVERKRRVDLKPEKGFWTIERYREEVSTSNSSQTPLSAGPVPGKVGVYLSYDSGTVSFYNADTKSHIHTFTGNKFVGKMYPFFGAWDENQWLKICFIPCSNQ
ncbi:nuclear factor 7, ovary-like [Amblyraja radiata]|uniref:nuclear factor 7, ovary-like n=1 Tax=Amblyraja radiata TaxID=386614 RepID=UPI001403E4F7|nr:nuclear factor 7, ovary-like [Amblyraja radiata]